MYLGDGLKVHPSGSTHKVMWVFKVSWTRRRVQQVYGIHELDEPVFIERMFGAGRPRDVTTRLFTVTISGQLKLISKLRAA